MCGEKNILAILTNSQEPEPGVFGSLGPEPLEKKNRSRSQSRLKKKSGARAGAGAGKKFAGSPALVYSRRSRVYNRRSRVYSRRSLFTVGGAHKRGRGTP